MSTVAQPNVATGTKVVQVRGVSKVFKRDAFQVTALDDVSIDIGKGEFLALMGASMTPRLPAGATSTSVTSFKPST